MVPGSRATRQQQDSRKFPFRCASGAARSERYSEPSRISTTHSLHLPCFRQEVGTWMPRDSAHSNRVEPGETRVWWWLKCSSTLMRGRSYLRGEYDNPGSGQTPDLIRVLN